MFDIYRWCNLLVAAARHSPETLAFIKNQLDVMGKSLHLTSHDRTDITYAPIRLSMIVDEQLPYEVMFQCTPDTIAFTDVLDMLESTCPQWKHSPQCDYYWVGRPNRAKLIEATENIKTQGGFPYQQLVVFVNKSAAAMIRLYGIETASEDFTDVMKKYSAT